MIIMLRAIVLIFLMTCMHSLHAQVMGGAAANGVNAQLRGLFSSIALPNPQPPAFYDHSAHYVEESWWQAQCSDTSTSNVFSVVYDELYTSHYDTTQFLRVDTVFDRAYRFDGDTSIIGIIYYRFAKLKDSALYDTTYFHIDTTGPTLLDNPNAASSPYLIDSIFHVCSMRDHSVTGRVVYRIDPAFIFSDPSLTISADHGRFLQLDFADGTGWHTVSATSVSHHTVTYDTAGERIIQARVVSSGTGDIEGSGNARVVTAAFDPGVPPDTTMTNIPGITVGVYPPCETAEGPIEPKFIIVLEGFDFFENTGIADVYNKHVRATRMDYLRNHGYTFLVVNWNNSKRDMRVNAGSVVALIDTLKCRFLDQTQQDGPQHQFVIMGVSMGGVIGRFALAWMEANVGASPCFPDNHHNTRLFISADSPHQGAYVPLAVQQLYKNTNQLLGGVYAPGGISELKERYDILNSMAAKQLLNLHITNSYFPMVTYAPHPERDDFIFDITALNPQTGGYPEHVKMLAISNGLLTGERQLGIDSGCVRTPGDAYLQGEGNLNLTILGVPVIGINTQIDLKTITNGGDFYRVQGATNEWGVELLWTWETVCLPPFNWPCWSYAKPAGVTVGLVNTTAFQFFRTAVNQPEYDVMPGGNMNFEHDITSRLSDAEYNLGLTWIDPTTLNLEWTPGNAQGNCNLEQIYATSLAGLQKSLDFDFYSHGMNFCFIPVQSALDYNDNVDQDHDIYNEDINVKMAAVPFDVIVGEINGLPGYPQPQRVSTLMHNDFASRWSFPSYNMSHVSIRNHQLPDSILTNWLNDTNSSSSPAPPWSYAFFLNREIGEEELFIDNLVLDRPAIFQVEYSLTSGLNQNPYYEYPGNQVQPQFIFRNYGVIEWPPLFINPNGYDLPNNGIFARANPLLIENDGLAILRAEDQIVTNGTVVQGGLAVELVPQWVCTLAVYKEEAVHMVNWNMSPELFPNPVSAGQPLHLRGIPQGECQLQLYDIRGHLLQSILTTSTAGYDLKCSIGANIPSGVYLLVVQSVGMRKTFKFIVQ